MCQICDRLKANWWQGNSTSAFKRLNKKSKKRKKLFQPALEEIEKKGRPVIVLAIARAATADLRERDQSFQSLKKQPGDGARLGGKRSDVKAMAGSPLIVD